MPGWALARWSCQLRGKDTTGYSWEWTRMFGATAWLQTWLSEHYSAEIAASTEFDNDGDHAVTELSGEKLAARGTQNLITERQLAVDFNSMAQQAGAIGKLGNFKMPTAAARHQG